MVWSKEIKNYVCIECSKDNAWERVKAIKHVDKIERVGALIKSCDDWLTAEAPKLQIPGYRILDTWLFDSREERLNRYRFKQQVRKRLLQYYLKEAKAGLKTYHNQQLLITIK